MKDNEKKYVIEIDDFELGCILSALRVLYAVHIALGDSIVISNFINTLSEKVGAIKND